MSTGRLVRVAFALRGASCAIRRRLARTLVIAAVIAIAPFAAIAPAQGEGRLDEDQVKAAFLYNFAKFVQWPAERQTGALVIGIVGDDFFAQLVEQIVHGKTVQGREIVVRRLKHDEDLTSSHILFIGGGEERRTPDLLKRLQAAPVLTVGETVHFIREGGMARFFVERNRVRFQINPTNAEPTGLKISSQLLSLVKD